MRVRINYDIIVSNVRNLFVFYLIRSRHRNFTDLFKLYKRKIVNPPLNLKKNNFMHVKSPVL